MTVGWLSPARISCLCRNRPSIAFGAPGRHALWPQPGSWERVKSSYLEIVPFASTKYALYHAQCTRQVGTKTRLVHGLPKGSTARPAVVPYVWSKVHPRSMLLSLVLLLMIGERSDWNEDQEFIPYVAMQLTITPESVTAEAKGDARSGVFESGLKDWRSRREGRIWRKSDSRWAQLEW